jgi:hypothetical protein
MIAVLLASIALIIAATYALSGHTTRRRSCLQVIAITVVVLVFALIRAASSGSLSECALYLSDLGHGAIAEVQR